MNLKKYHEYIQNLYFMNPNGFQFFSILSLAAITALLFHLLLAPGSQTLMQPEKSLDAATYIPKGHSLIPLQLVNQRSLGSLIENFGWIDLYSATTSESGYKKGPKIVKKIRILRAPLDPSQFGIIVPNDFVDFILDWGPDYFATISRSKFYKSELVIRSKKKKRVIYEDMF